MDYLYANAVYLHIIWVHSMIYFEGLFLLELHLFLMLIIPGLSTDNFYPHQSWAILTANKIKGHIIAFSSAFFVFCCYWDAKYFLKYWLFLKFWVYLERKYFKKFCHWIINYIIYLNVLKILILYQNYRFICHYKLIVCFVIICIVGVLCYY